MDKDKDWNPLISLIIDPFGAMFGKSIFDNSHVTFRTTIQEGFDAKFSSETTEGHYRITIEVPGFDENEISIQTKGNKIDINAEHTGKERVYFHNKIHRAWTLPEEIDPSKVDAVLKNGILTVTIPRCESPPEKIKVKSIK
jgi:HSP20 family protein